MNKPIYISTLIHTVDGEKKDVSLSLSNNTLWNILEEPKIIGARDFEHLFAKTTTQTKRKPLSETYEKKAKARKVMRKIKLNVMQVILVFWGVFAVCCLSTRGG